MNPYPGRIIRKGEANTELVKAIQQRLQASAYRCVVNGIYDDDLASVVSLFQAQNVDLLGNPLQVDGKVGPFTWDRLFDNVPKVDAGVPSSALLLQALGVAISQVGVREQPEGSNSGPMVDRYLQSVGIAPGQGGPDQRYWCAAFLFWCHEQAATALGRGSPLVRTAGCLDHWNKAGKLPNVVRITKKQALADPTVVVPGLIFIQDHGRGAGHTGIVERSESGRLFTVEGNIAPAGSPGRNGVGVFRSERRKLTDDELVGFIDYSRA